MLGIDLRKIYRFSPVEPAPAVGSFPVGAAFYYECLDCQAIVSSVPHAPAKCVCGNLSGGSGSLEIQVPERVRVMTGKLK
jgi:hypothetical protein